MTTGSQPGTHPFSPPRLLTGEEVADLLRTNRQTLRYWRHIGYGPRSFKVGRHVLYAKEDVDGWIAGRRTDADQTSTGP